MNTRRYPITMIKPDERINPDREGLWEKNPHTYSRPLDDPAAWGEYELKCLPMED